MTLRTPRRRISPRTKRRCRAIKDFLRRIAGNSSQPDIKINSSIAVNVSNLKHQIGGLDQQVKGESKHLIYADCTSTSDVQSRFSKTYSKLEATAKASRLTADRENYKSVVSDKSELLAERNSLESKTKLLFKTSHDRKSDDSELLQKHELDSNEVQHVASKWSARVSPKTHRRARNSKYRHHTELTMEHYLPYYEKHKSKSAYEQLSAFSANSYHSLIEPRHHDSRGDFDGYRKRHSSRHGRRRAFDRGEIPRDTETREMSPKRIVRNEDKYMRRRKEKHSTLDEDFINNIIKRQYKPVKLFGKRESNLSQFSAPICRDQEFSIAENIIEEAELCSCCYADRNHKYTPYHELSDMRSICDTRLYSSNKNTRQKTYRRPANHYNYNDTSMYDVVPVKEKSSPKTRRKFMEDMMCYSYYKEVPPSPRTQRPRLNLKAQHFNEMEFKEGDHCRSRKNSPNRHNRCRDFIDSSSNDSSTVVGHKIPYNIKNKQDNVKQTIGTSSTLPPPLFMDEATNHQAETTNTTSLINKSQDIDSSTDKTDKALSEIKEILLTFLQEIKKDNIPQIEKENSCKNEGNHSSGIKQNNNFKINSSFENPSCHSDINNCSMAPFAIPTSMPPPFIPPPYLNPCCYPVLPSYPINCMQNGYVLPTSPSFTCANCTNKTEQPQSPKNEDEANNTPKRNTETDKLIKEIYNLVTQSPPSARKRDNGSVKSHRTVADKKKPVVTRSAGDSVRITRHDAKVGTPKMKYYSKSCEAFGSQMDEEHSVNTSYSDTVLEKLSVDAAAADTTTTETENTTDDTISQKKSKLTNVLRSFGLMKKKKYVIEEEEEEDEEETSDSESSTEVEATKKKRQKPQFPQEFANYMMYGQEHFHPPPIPPHLQQEYLANQPGFYNLRNPYGPYPGYPIPPYHPSAPPCPCAFEGAQNPNQKPPGTTHPIVPHPEAPFSLKEIEVKSAATQSERKFSFLGKFGKKKPEMSKPNPRNFSTQTPPPPAPPKPSFWERLQTPKPATESDPRMFSFKKQKELAAGDANIKKAMLKKLFHKRNPFSPGNLIVRTLLGKDPSSFGEPPAMYRPRMFL